MLILASSKGTIRPWKKAYALGFIVLSLQIRMCLIIEILSIYHNASGFLNLDGGDFNFY